jgi:hypothetical protein
MGVTPARRESRRPLLFGVVAEEIRAWGRLRECACSRQFLISESKSLSETGKTTVFRVSGNVCNTNNNHPVYENKNSVFYP